MLSIIKKFLRNPLYLGTAYAIEYFIFFAVIPIVTFNILSNYGLFFNQIDPLTLIIFGASLSILIFLQKFLRRSYYRLSALSGILRYLVALVWVFVFANMLRSIWIYGSIWEVLSRAFTWATVDYSFFLWLVVIVFLIRFVRYGYQIIFAKDLKGEPGVETLEEEIRREVED
ncbi:MAG: hypothetical protein ACUVXA_10470 [Candidatus Jordarchaeum sp.]|uniref:hypothetical protein n=1 Tax=Candidatus Jordarchaeum sp. TaxID=2823881 RepID=UPI00404A0C43